MTVLTISFLIHLNNSVNFLLHLNNSTTIMGLSTTIIAHNITIIAHKITIDPPTIINLIINILSHVPPLLPVDILLRCPLHFIFRFVEDPRKDNHGY